MKRGALLYLACDEVDLNHTDAVGPTANLLLYKIISVQKSQTKFILKAQWPGDDSECSDVPIEDIIVGVKLYRKHHVHAAPPGAAAADAPAVAEAAATTAAAAAAASAPAAPVPQIPNVVTLRFGMQSRYTSAEYQQSGFFAAFEVDLSRLVSRVEGPAPPCGSSGTVFKKQLNGHLTGACRVDGVQGMRFKVDGVYDATKIITRGRAPRGEESKPLKLSLFANHGSFVASLCDARIEPRVVAVLGRFTAEEKKSTEAVDCPTTGSGSEVPTPID